MRDCPTSQGWTTILQVGLSIQVNYHQGHIHCSHLRGWNRVTPFHPFCTVHVSSTRSLAGSVECTTCTFKTFDKTMSVKKKASPKGTSVWLVASYSAYNPSLSHVSEAQGAFNTQFFFLLGMVHDALFGFSLELREQLLLHSIMLWFTRCRDAMCCQSNQEHRCGEPLLFLISALGSFTYVRAYTTNGTNGFTTNPKNEATWLNVLLKAIGPFR